MKRLEYLFNLIVVAVYLFGVVVFALGGWAFAVNVSGNMGLSFCIFLAASASVVVAHLAWKEAGREYRSRHH